MKNGELRRISRGFSAYVLPQLHIPHSLILTAFYGTKKENA